MVAEVTRGVKFVLGTAVDPGAIKAFEAIEKRVDALQKRMNMTLSVTERASRAANGANGNGSGGSVNTAARAAERAMQLRERAAERAFKLEAKWNREAEAAVAKREAAEARAAQRTEREARRAADTQAREAKRAADAQIREIRRVEQEQERALREAAREDARGWRRLSAQGRDAFTTNRKTSAGFDALSAMGRAAMPRDPFAEGLRRMEDAKAMRSGWAGLGFSGADAQNKLNALRSIEAADEEKRKRALADQKGQLHEINSALYDVAHAFGQVTRAAGQFSLIGQRDMARMLDTVFALEGGINAIQGGMNAFRAIRAIREAKSAGGATKYAAGLARLGGAAASGTAAAGGASGLGLGSIGLAGAGVTALAAGGIAMLGTFADRNRGVPGQVGGFWDTLGKAVNSPLSTASRGFRSVGSAIERGLNEPYGLTDKESDYRSLALHEAEFQRDFGKELGANESPYAARKRAELWEERTELMEKYTNREMDRREAMRLRREEIDSFEATGRAQQRAAGFDVSAQRYGLRQGALGRRADALGNNLSGAFGRQQAAYGEQLGLASRRAIGQFVSPAQAARAAAEQAREEGLVTGFEARQLNNLRTQLTANRQRGTSLGQELGAARSAYQSADSQAGREAAFGPMQAAEERLKQNAEERAKIEEKIRQVGIEGAQRQLQLREQSLSVAKQTADALRQRGQSATEDFGRLLPGQQRAVIRAAEDAASGKQMNRYQRELLERHAPGLFEEQIREDLNRRAKEGGIDRVLELSGHNRRLGNAEQAEGQATSEAQRGRDEVAGKIYDSAERAGTDLANLIVPFVEQAFGHFVEQVDARIKTAVTEMIVKERQQGRAGAGT